MGKDKESTRVGLEQQLKRIIDLLNLQRETSIKVIGSYLYDEAREICPPHLNNYQHAFPRF
jgi:hypothetical protein